MAPGSQALDLLQRLLYYLPALRTARRWDCVFLLMLLSRNSVSISWSEIREGYSLTGPVAGREEGEKQPRLYGLEVVGHLSPPRLCLCGEGGLSAPGSQLFALDLTVKTTTAEGKMGTPACNSGSALVNSASRSRRQDNSPRALN